MAYEANRKKETRLKHVRVYDQLYRLIQEGVFPAGSQLPSEPVLAGQLSVSRMTLRRALALLQEDHLVKNIRGKGNFICAPSSCTPPFETGRARHPIYSCCTQPFEEVELELRSIQSLMGYLDMGPTPVKNSRQQETMEMCYTEADTPGL